MKQLAMGALCMALAACAPVEEPPVPVSVAGRVVHLADRLGEAEVEAVEPRAVEQVVWTFENGEAAPWVALDGGFHDWMAGVETEALADGVALRLGTPPARRSLLLIGGLRIELEAPLRLADWRSVQITARTSDRFAGLAVAHNLDDEGAVPTEREFFMSTGEIPPMFNDGSIQTYAIPLRSREGEDDGTALTSLGVLFGALEPAEVDVLAVRLEPRGADFPRPVGVRSVLREGETRTALYARAPARLKYDLEIPAGGRLDFGLTTEPGDEVIYSVMASGGDGERELLREAVAGGGWLQRSVDLSAFADEAVELVLAAESEQEGTLAIWGAPVVSAGGGSERPDVVFYVIDGAGADFMSVYGYDRPTTPFLEELASEAVVFERAYASATWTQPSTVSFMTSLHHSVLGGLRRGVHSTAVPKGAVTMAEHMRRGGYLTASFTANPNAGRIIGLERGVDVMADGETEHHSTSSKDLHQRFWTWRERYPGAPYWVHFQTTDVHEPNEPHEPFAGTWVAAEERERIDRWQNRLFAEAGYLFGSTSIAGFYDQALEITGIDRRDFFDGRRGLYDETMLYQDEQLRQLVDRLKDEGRWERTLLVIASDHGHPAGTFARWGRGLLEPQPAEWQGALFDSYSTRVPLMFVWSGTVEGGRRIERPVSMVDVLPTLLDLVGLPAPEVLQGQSLAAMLTGEGELEARPVVLDEFRVDEATGEMIGNLEIIDGRWGATLEIGPTPDGSGAGRHAVPSGGRWAAHHPFFPQASRLLLYDLEEDPLATTAVNDLYPEKVAQYDRMLRAQWRAHRALAQRFGEAEDASLSPEQLQQLKALGYIQ